MECEVLPLIMSIATIQTITIITVMVIIVKLSCNFEGCVVAFIIDIEVDEVAGVVDKVVSVELVVVVVVIVVCADVAVEDVPVVVMTPKDNVIAV